MRQSRQGRAASRAPQDAVVLATLAATRTYLALDTPEQLRPASMMTRVPYYLKRVSPCPGPVYRALYKAVGAEWHWHDRDAWSDERLAEHLANPKIAVWAASLSGANDGGFFELQRHDDGSVEIVYFGLARPLIGFGIGGWMLTCAATEAWAFGANRVWLHTCTLDSPNALPNYKKRGFVPFKTEDYQQEVG